MPPSLLNQQKKNQFDTTATKAQSAVAQGIGSTLKKNTQPFNPATAGQFNTSPKIDFSKLSLGVKAKAPEQNLKVPATTLKKSEQATVQQATPQNNALYQQPMTTPSGMPITGNPATFAGNQNQQTPQPQQGLYSQLINQLSTKPPSQAYIEGLEKYGDISQQIADVGMQGARAQAGYKTTGTTPVAEGNAAVIAQTTAAQQAALGEQQQAALTQAGLGQTQQGLEQGAIGTAAGLAAPQTAEYGKTVFDPVTGQYTGGGTGDFSASMDTFATQLASGALGVNQVPTSITSNPILYAQLLQKTQQKNPNFNVTQSNANQAAQTQALQQNVTTGLTMQRSAQAATQALDTLQTAYNNLSSIAQGGVLGMNVPIISGLAQQVGMASGLGREQISAFQGALKEARAQINTVLAPLIGVESANATSNSLLPDNMTPQEVPQKISAAKEYIQQRVEAFTQTGGVPQYGQSQNYAPTNGSTAGAITWDSLGD